jgi:hypothetical protein
MVSFSTQRRRTLLPSVRTASTLSSAGTSSSAQRCGGHRNADVFFVKKRRRTLSFASIHKVEKRRSGEAEKWRSGEVEKWSSGLDVRFSAWTKSFATQRQMVSFASIRPSVHPSATRRSGEAVKWRSGVVDWTSAKRCHLRPST